MSEHSAYRQIADQLRSAIQSGYLLPGEQLPSEQEIIDQTNASRGTVRQAILVLKAEGLVETKQGSGNFVGQFPAPSSTADSLRRQADHLRSIADVLERLARDLG